MTLVLSNDEIARLLPVDDCLERLEEMYTDLGQHKAVNRPRSDMYAPPGPNGRYILKSMDGLTPRYKVAAIRLNSDTIQWSHGAAGIRKDKQPIAPGGTWVGLVLIFSTETGEPIAIMPDGVMQKLRVASTNAIAAKYMAPPNAQVYAQIGAGWQAGAQALAIARVRPISEIRVFSPTSTNRERLALQLGEELGIQVRAVDSARSAVTGADIIGMATNSVSAVVEADWVSNHAHLTCVKSLELGDGVLERSSQVVVHTRIDRPANYIVGRGEEPIYGHDPQEGLSAELGAARAARIESAVDLTRAPDLGELVAGKVSPAPPGTITCFVNTMGLGTQFAALGALALQRARDQGIGVELPTELFLENVHP